MAGAMPRRVGTEAANSRQDVVIRAFRRLMSESPGGWYSAPQVQGAIGADLALPRAHSTVRESWRFGKRSLLAKSYLGVRTFQTTRGPEIRYFLRYVDGRISVPADQFHQMPREERERLFPPPVRTEAEERAAGKEAMKTLAKGLSWLTKLALAAESTDALEQELLDRLRNPATQATSGFAEDHPELQQAHVRFRRPPSLEFARAIEAGLTGSGAPPSSRSTAPQIPSPRRAGVEPRRRRQPSRRASSTRRAS
jgi:hypothetical protein